MAQKKDYPLRFLEIIAGIIKKRKSQGLYSREVKQKRLEVRPKLSGKKIGVANDNTLKIANVTIKKKRLPKKKNKYILIPLPNEKKAKKNKKSTSKIAKKSKPKESGPKRAKLDKRLDKSKAKDSASKKPKILKGPKKQIAKRQPTKTKRSNSNKTQNIVTLEPYINAQPKKVTLSLDGVKQDSSQNKSEIPMKYPLEKIVLGELKEPRDKSVGKRIKISSKERFKKEKLNPINDSSSKKASSKKTSPKKATPKKAKAKQVASNKKAKDSKSKKSKTKKPIPKSKRSITKESNDDKRMAQNKEELLSKIKTLEDWMAKVKGTVNDKTIKNLEKKLSSLKARVSNMK